ncbi:hypothetical protein CUMW_025620 [Citrus unshiu]|nr:hypothetical protein CUMW_025620 [Citrus unshiu]
MDTTSLKTFNAIVPLHAHFRSRAPNFTQFKNNFSFSSPLSSFSSFRFSPICSLPERENGGFMPRGVGEAVNGLSQNKFLQVVLVSPQTTSFLGAGSENSIVLGRFLETQPLGFQVDDTKLKRAGLDYWPYVVVKVHSTWAEFRDYFRQQEGEKRLLAFTKRGTSTHSEISYRKGDYLIFGSETSGLPPEALLDCTSETFGGGTIRIPMVETYVRCLNLSVSVGIAVYEAARQLNYEQLKTASDTCIDREFPFITEDIFA